MNSSLKLQLDVKNNAQDLQNYMLDLKNWEEEMKRKENALNSEKTQESIIPPPRNKIKRSKPESEKKSFAKPKKISAYDYSAWDKFDVEKACAEVDEEVNSEEKCFQEAEGEVISKNEVKGGDNDNDNDCMESNKFSLIDEAFFEKELGNQFVKKEQWSDAIKCYTNAISLDSNNAIYYANRSLCFLKLKNFKSAETDATTAIQLDKKYIKAYQRRAFARLALGQLAEAKSDYEDILQLEPKNALARYEIIKINERLNKEQNISKTNEKKIFNPKQMFKHENIKSEIKKSVETSKNVPSATKSSNSSEAKMIASKPVLYSNEIDRKFKNKSMGTIVNKKNPSSENEDKGLEKGDNDQVIPCHSIESKSQVFKPLPEWCKIIHPVNLPPHKRPKSPLRRINITFINKDEDINELEEPKNEDSCVCNKKEEIIRNNNSKSHEKRLDEDIDCEQLVFDIPKTAIQFNNCWKIIKKNPEKCYSYLKKIPAEELPKIFENSLESDFFSELITFLASDEIKKEPEVIYEFLFGLTKVKRFSSLILFMSEADKKCVRKSISELEKFKSKEKIIELLRLYELNVQKN